jgi:g-D-glutamyl-meso-diaminopimelate peptidase
MDIYQSITEFYEGVTTQKQIIGRSVFGRNIYAVKVGEGSPVGIAQYAIHGREYITAKLAVAQYKIGVKKGSCWLIPLVNPDGALLSEVGLTSVKLRRQASLLKINKTKDFSHWKANGRGVDLNVNFDADWGQGAKNVFKPSPENYVGKKPFSEPETRALRRFTLKIKPDYTLSYHTKGEEIYWYFYQSGEEKQRAYFLAQELSDLTGYSLAFARGSVGGYKDWCIERFGIPSFTIEMGKDEFLHPLKERELDDIIEHNLYALYELSARI